MLKQSRRFQNYFGRFLFSGRSSVSYEVPASSPQSKMTFNRSGITVMEAVTGESVKKWYFFGLVQSIDGHLIIFGLSNYEIEKSAGISVFDEVIQRAHYKALIKAPEADYLLSPKYTIRENGFIPFVPPQRSNDKRKTGNC